MTTIAERAASDGQLRASSSKRGTRPLPYAQEGTAMDGKGLQVMESVLDEDYIKGLVSDLLYPTAGALAEEVHAAVNAAGDVPLASSADAIRATPEYRIAWDLELWRQVEMRKFTKSLKEKEKAAALQLTQAIARKEQEAARQRDRRLVELQAREERLANDRAGLEKLKGRLLEAERELHRKEGELQDYKTRLERETEDRVRRVTEDYAHKLELERNLNKEIADISARVQHRLDVSQKEYVVLWEEFAAFKARMMIEGGDAGGGTYRQLISQVANSEVIQLTEKFERQLSQQTAAHKGETAELQSKVDKSNKICATLKERCSALERELAGLRLQLATETGNKNKRSMDGSPASKTATKSETQMQMDKLSTAAQESIKQMSESARKLAAISVNSAAIMEGTGPRSGATPAAIARLQADKTALLSTGAYTERSEIIIEIDKKILEMRERLLTEKCRNK